MLNRVRNLICAATLAGTITGCGATNETRPQDRKPDATPVTTQPASTASAAGATTKPAQAADAASQWRTLFDGQSMKNWKAADFGGSGEPAVKNGALVIPMGATLSGVTWAGEEIPTMNYEVSLEAQRVSGSDFFCGLTFPYEETHATLVVGGWGGGVVGISSIDGNDAANNFTASAREFEDKRWYKIRLRVTPDLIEAWIDNEKVVDAEVEGRTIDTRIDVDLSKPMGVTTYQTTAALRDVKIRRVPEGEVKKRQPAF